MNKGFDKIAEPFPLACSVISARIEPGQLVIRGEGMCYGDSTFSTLGNIVDFSVFRNIF